MISVEVCYIDGLDEQNFNLAKCILKLKNSYTGGYWFRVNPNYVKLLDKLELIKKNEYNKSYVRLTPKGEAIKIFFDTLNLSLDEYFVHESDLHGFVEDSLGISVPLGCFKIIHNTCHCCGKTKSQLTHIVDEHNDGMYCTICLNKGYVLCLATTNNRRKEAQNAFSIRQN